MHVISPLQQQTLGEAAFSPGHALQVGVQRKLSSHLSNCRSAGLKFIPLVFESLGGLAEDSVSTLRSLGRSIALRTGPLDASVCSKQLFYRAAVALWRGMLVCGCTASHPSPPHTSATFHILLLSYVRRGLCDPLFFFLRRALCAVQSSCTGAFAALVPHMPCMLLVLLYKLVKRYIHTYCRRTDRK